MREEAFLPLWAVPASFVQMAVGAAGAGSVVFAVSLGLLAAGISLSAKRRARSSFAFVWPFAATLLFAQAAYALPYPVSAQAGSWAMVGFLLGQLVWLGVLVRRSAARAAAACLAVFCFVFAAFACWPASSYLSPGPDARELPTRSPNIEKDAQPL